MLLPLKYLYCVATVLLCVMPDYIKIYYYISLSKRLTDQDFMLVNIASAYFNLALNVKDCELVESKT